jgi:hypothetical protein
MDYIMAFLVIIMGVIPPILVGYWAYRQGLKGRQEAMTLRDEAIEQVEDMRDQYILISADLRKAIDAIKIPEIPPYPSVPTVDEIVAALPPVRIPEDQLESIKASIKGILGNFVKTGIAGAEDHIEGARAEMVQQDPASAFQGAILGKILKFLNKD